MAGRTLTAGAAGGGVGARPARRARALAVPRASLLLLPPLLLLVFGSFFLNGTDADYWWHARTGRYIAETGGVPTTDPFSHTVAGRPWVSHEWLTDLVLYAVERGTGYVGNVALFGLVGVLTLLATYAACRRRGVGELGAALLMLWAFTMMLPMLNVRPQLVTMLFLATSALLLTRYRQDHDRRALWAFPPLLALWVNLHGGYVIGLVLLGLTVAGETIARWRGEAAAPIRPLLVTTILAALATLLTPHGLDALRYPLTYVGAGNASMRLVQEWQSPNFHQPAFLIFGASLLLLLVLGLGRRPLGPTDILWAVVLTLMSLRSLRHIALYAVVVLPLLGARLQAELPALRQPFLNARRPLVVALLALTWLLPAVAIAGVAAAPARLQTGRAPSAAGYPAGAVAYIRAHDLRGNLFNQYHWGGYLIYELAPDPRVFIDGRADPFGDDLVVRFRETTQLRPGWRRTLDDYAVDLVLMEKESPLAAALAGDPAWQEVYTGEVERLFVRRP